MNTKRLLDEIGRQLTGQTAPRPSGQLSGHAGGLVFEEMVHRKLVEAAPKRAYRHYEALNEAILQNTTTGAPPESTYFGEPPLHLLVSRGKKATKTWSTTNLFEEKQNDTAETILFSEQQKLFASNHIDLIDIKSQNMSKKSQPPNIISANKLSKVAKIVISGNTEPNFDIYYLAVKFNAVEDKGTKLLKAIEWRTVNLFKTNPSNLYINWAAALQIQFHPFEVDQTFKGTRREWLELFLKDCYADSLQKRIEKQQSDLEEVFEVLEVRKPPKNQQDQD